MSTERLTEGERLRRLRPWFLVAAMVLTWLAGVRGATSGCVTVLFLREGAMPDDVAALEHARAAPNPTEGLSEFFPTAQLRAFAELGSTMMPLSIAKMLLAMMLVFASAMVMSGRQNARSFALQALFANAAFAIVAYVLMRPVRDHWIGAMVRAGAELGVPRTLPDGLVGDPRFWYWLERIELGVFELGVFAIGALAILAKRSKVFLDEAARAGPAPESEEDEP